MPNSLLSSFLEQYSRILLYLTDMYFYPFCVHLFVLSYSLSCNRTQSLCDEHKSREINASSQCILLSISLSDTIVFNIHFSRRESHKFSQWETWPKSYQYFSVLLLNYRRHMPNIQPSKGCLRGSLQDEEN
jgi:hypothetical protein